MTKFERAEQRLQFGLEALERLVPNAVRRTNIALIAQSCANQAAANGERFHPGNATVYPAKHYTHLERTLGVLSAPDLSYFDQVYTLYMQWHSEVES